MEGASGGSLQSPQSVCVSARVHTGPRRAGRAGPWAGPWPESPASSKMTSWGDRCRCRSAALRVYTPEQAICGRRGCRAERPRGTARGFRAPTSTNSQPAQPPDWRLGAGNRASCVHVACRVVQQWAPAALLVAARSLHANLAMDDPRGPTRQRLHCGGLFDGGHDRHPSHELVGYLLREAPEAALAWAVSACLYTGKTPPPCPARARARCRRCCAMTCARNARSSCPWVSHTALACRS